MDIERYKQEQSLPPDQAALDAAYQNIKDSFENRVNFPGIFDGVVLFDRMGRATLPGTKSAFEAFGRDPQISQSLFDEIDTARAAGDDERVMLLIRVSHLMGRTEDPLLIKAANFIPPLYHPLRKLAEVLGQDSSGSVRMGQYDLWFEDHKQQLEAKRAAAAGARARTGTGQGAGVPPSPDWEQEDITTKSPEWMIVRQDIEAKWNDASRTLPNDPMFYSTLDRFTAAFTLLQRVILSTPAPGGRAVQNMIEFLIPRIWVYDTDFQDFFDQCKLEAPTQRNDNPSHIADIDELSAALFIPPTLRGRSDPLTPNRQDQIGRIYRRLTMGTHPDSTSITANPDTNPFLQHELGELFKLVDDRYKIIKGKLFS